MPVPTEREELQEQDELAGQMSFFDHLEELRRRILNSLIAVGVAFCACWWLQADLFRIFSRLVTEPPFLLQYFGMWDPNAAVAHAQLNMQKIQEGFTVQLKLIFMAAIFLAAPFIMAQVWLFIAPGLYRHERRYALPFIFFSSLLFLVGGLFGYFVAIPFAITFLVQFGSDLGLATMLSVSEALDLVIALELGMGIVFEIPAVIFLLSRLGIVSGGFLLKNTKYALLGSFVTAAIITPTGDIPNMMIMAVPMIALYMLGVVVAFIFGKKRKTDADV